MATNTYNRQFKSGAEFKSADGTWQLKVKIECETEPHRPAMVRKRVRGDRDHVGMG